MQAERAGLRIIDQAGGIVRAHLEQHAHFKFAERFAAEETIHVVVSVARDDHVECRGSAFGDQLLSNAGRVAAVSASPEKNRSPLRSAAC